MPDFGSIATSTWDVIRDYVPAVLGALAILVVGLIVARIVGRIVAKALSAAGVDRLADRVGLPDALASVGMSGPLSALVGTVLRLAITVVVVISFVSQIGIGPLNEALAGAIAFIPHAILALVILVVGALIGQRVRGPVERLSEQMALPNLGAAVQGAVLAFALLMALTELRVPTVYLAAAGAVLLGSIGLALALAVGTGSRELVRQLSAGRFARDTFALGDRIAVDDLEGDVTAIERTAVVIRTPSGSTVRIPNERLLTQPVRIETRD